MERGTEITKNILIASHKANKNYVRLENLAKILQLDKTELYEKLISLRNDNLISMKTPTYKENGVLMDVKFSLTSKGYELIENDL